MMWFRITLGCLAGWSVVTALLPSPGSAQTTALDLLEEDDDVAARRRDPYCVADEVVEALLGRDPRHG